MQSTFEIERLHTPAQIEAELRFCLDSGAKLTLGRLLQLKLKQSPFLDGGVLTPEVLAETIAIMGGGKADEVCRELTEGLAAAWRVWEIFPPDCEKGKSRYDAYSPEWMCDLITLAAEALPSLTYHQALWEMPLVALFHLYAAAHRKNGGCTRRPDNDAEVFRMLQEINLSS